MTVFAVSMGSVEGKWALLSQNTHALIAASLGTAFFLRARRGLAQTGSWVGLLHIGSNCFQHAAGTGGHIGDDASDAGAEDGRCEEALLPPLLTHELGADQRG